MVLRSEEEKLKLIKEFKESGLSIYQWCKNNHISNSCVYVWLKKYGDDTRLKSKTTNNKDNEIKFIELDNTTSNTKSNNRVKNMDNEILLEYKDFKINITNYKAICNRTKNWLFSNTVNGANASTIIYSIIQTAIANELKSEQYLKYVFKQIQQNGDVEKYVPWFEKIPEYCKIKKPK